MKVLHPKIEALRVTIGSTPIHYFFPKKEHELLTRAPKSTVDNTDERLCKQYFAIFGVPDDYGTVPVKGCFSKSLNERGPNTNAQYKVTVLYMHDQKDPLCIPLVLREDEVGLYGEYKPDAVPSGDRVVLQIRSGTINNGSYGFNYVWDKMEYDDATGLIMMKELDLYEVSPVTIGSQKQTFAVRSASGIFEDKLLVEETEDMIKQLPRKYHLEIRSIIDRHIALALLVKPAEQQQEPLESREPKEAGDIDWDFLLNKFKN